MRWRTNENAPKSGDIREIIEFSWFPTRLLDGNTVWFEDYVIVQEWYYSKTYNRVYKTYVGMHAWRTVATRAILDNPRG